VNDTTMAVGDAGLADEVEEEASPSPSPAVCR
jgi:hypothetical protein